MSERSPTWTWYVEIWAQDAAPGSGASGVSPRSESEQAHSPLKGLHDGFSHTIAVLGNSTYLQGDFYIQVSIIILSKSQSSENPVTRQLVPAQEPTPRTRSPASDNRLTAAPLSPHPLPRDRPAWARPGHSPGRGAVCEVQSRRPDGCAVRWQQGPRAGRAGEALRAAGTALGPAGPQWANFCEHIRRVSEHVSMSCTGGPGARCCSLMWMEVSP